MNDQKKLEFKLETGFGHGIHLPQLGIGLDTRKSNNEIQIISHAHADHVPYSSKNTVIASPATSQLMKARGFKDDVTELDFFTPLETNSCKITLFPAGHILGSSQILIESDYGTLFYTGDFRNPPSPTSEGYNEPDVPIDIYIAEATFGLPIYRWKSHDILNKRIIDFAQESLQEGYTPVFIAYNLGKAQEVMHALAKATIEMQIHYAGFNLCKVYNDFGFDLGNYTTIQLNEIKHKAVIAPSNALDSKQMKSIKKKRLAYVSGWADLEARQQQMNIDARIPLSDHIDFYELLEVVKRLKPQKTYITHSPTPDIVCHFLLKDGFDAQPLGANRDMEDN